MGQILTYQKNEVGVICKYVTLYDLFQSQVNKHAIELEEQAQNSTFLDNAAEVVQGATKPVKALAQGTADGAKKIGAFGKN